MISCFAYKGQSGSFKWASLILVAKLSWAGFYAKWKVQASSEILQYAL